MAVDFAEVGTQQEGDALFRAVERQRVDDQSDQQQDHERHHDLAELFDPFFDAPHHDESDEGDEGEGPEHGTPAVVDVLLENRPDLLGTLPVESVYEGDLQEFERPARDHRIERQDDRRGGDTQVARAVPVSPGRKPPEGPQGIGLRVAPETELGEHDRDADQCADRDVNQDEGAAAVFTRDIGEPPDVAQPHHRAADDGYGAEAAAE